MRTAPVKTAATAAGLMIMTAFCGGPIIWMLIVAFARHPDFLLPHIPFAGTADNFSAIVTSRSVHLLSFLKNSLVISSLAAAITTFIAALSAYSISRMQFPGRRLLPLLVLGSAMFPQISIVGYLFRLLTFLGMINTYSALILPYISLGLPLALWIMISHLSRISSEIDDAASIDGASRFQIFSRIMLPLLLPGLMSAFLLVFIFCFNEFLFALMFTVDDNARTIPVGIALFEGLHGQIPWGYIMAGAVIAVTPVILIISFFQRYLIDGLTEGSLKG